MGQHFRLGADFNIWAFSPEVRAVLRALKEYGVVLADNGSSRCLPGAPHPRWNNDHLAELRLVPGSAFEAVAVSSLMEDSGSGRVRRAEPPVAVTVPWCTNLPSDPNGDGLYADTNGNGRFDFADVAWLFNNL